MSLKDTIYDKIIKPQNDTKFDNLVGRVSTYNKENNTANVLFKNPKNLGVMELENVPVFVHKGFKTQSLKSGDNVYITFLNGSIMQPCITGVVDRAYIHDTRVKQRHRRKGSYIVSREYEDVEILTYKDKSGVASWIDSECEDCTKYYTHMNSEPVYECIEAISNVSYFKEDDIGLYHPDISSIVKLTEEGCIDIFTQSNTGIRVNPHTKSIKFLSENLNFSGDKWYIESDEFVFKGKNFNVDSDVININAKTFNLKYENKEVE